MRSLVRLSGASIWRSRPVRYFRGDWAAIQAAIPEFELLPFKTPFGQRENRFVRTVVRKPLREFEEPVPVGLVSQTYALVQHLDFAKRCLQGLADAGVSTDGLSFTLGLSELDEWMSLSIALPDKYSYQDPFDEKLGLTLECFNSVDGTSRLVVLFGWFRFICSNGLVIGETRIEIKEKHGQSLDVAAISHRVQHAMEGVKTDRKRLDKWQNTAVAIPDIAAWADGILATEWGKAAAARTFHICASGFDVEFEKFSPSGVATKKPVRPACRVPGSPERAKTQYDVAQALSYVATRRNNAEERVARQAEIPRLLNALA